MNIPASTVATLGVGFVLGLRHALDTDHLVAVGTLVARERSLWRSTQIGAIWGLGHTVTLFAMGLLIIGFGLSIPEYIGHWLELSVAAMLILLGVRTLWLWKRGEGHICAHEHNGHRHVHFHKYGQHPCTDDLAKPSSQGSHSQSFLVGMVHGLSGCAELMLLVLATIHHPLWALAFIAIFGVGMMVAMFALTGIFAHLLNFTARFQNGWAYVDSGLRIFSGVASLAFGSLLLWQSYRG